MLFTETAPVKRLTETITTEQLEAATRTLTLADAMRLGAEQTEQSVGNWGHGDRACALTTAAMGAAAAHYIK